MDSWLSRAAGLYISGRADLAEKLLDKALAAGQESAPLRALRCRCLTARQSYREAEADALRALELEPEYADALNALSWCHFRARRIEKASDAIEEALRLDPNDSRHHQMRGIIRYARRQLAEALTCLDEALRLDPDNSDAAGLKAQILMARGHTDRAMEAARAALSQDPEDGALLETVAWAHLEKCNPELAEQAFRDALRKDPTNASAQEGLRVATERLYSWKVGAGMGLTAAALAGLGWTGTLPAGMLGAVVIGLVGTLASPLGLIHRQRLQGAMGCLVAVALLLGLALFLLMAVLLSKLEEAPPEQWRKYSLILIASAFGSAALSAAIEYRGRRGPESKS